MASYVGPEPELLERAKHLWGIHGEFQLLRCNENWVYLLEDANLVFRFTADYHRSPEQLKAELEWIHYLAKQRCSVVLPVASTAGELVIRLNDGQFGVNNASHTTKPNVVIKGEELPAAAVGWSVTVFERARGKALVDDSQFTPEIFKTWGRCIGELHRRTLAYAPRESVRPQWDNDDGYHLAMNMVKKLGAEHFMVKTYTDLLAQIHQLPKSSENFGLIHADIHHGNFFVDNSGSFVIFDFDDCCYHWLLFDLAVPLATMELRFLRGQSPISLRHFQRELLEGYSEEYPLPKKAEETIELFVKYRIAHNYLWAAARIDAGRTNDVAVFENWMNSCVAYFKKSPSAPNH